MFTTLIWLTSQGHELKKPIGEVLLTQTQTLTLTLTINVRLGSTLGFSGSWG